MEPLQIVLIVLVIAGVWLVVELALTARRARRTMDEVDKTVAELNETLAETRPVVAKLDGAVDDLQPALAKVDPLLTSANVAVDALSANLIEVEGVVRDVSAITGAAASAGNAVSGVADSASEAARKLLGKLKPSPAGEERTLEAPSSPSLEGEQDAGAEAAQADDAEEPVQGKYYTYDAGAHDLDAGACVDSNAGEAVNE